MDQLGGNGRRRPAQPGTDDWNIEHRDEGPLRRADRNFIELLQELRVVLTGVQILFGFLLTASFSERFDRLDPVQLQVFVVTLCCAATSSAFLVAPVAAHRLAFQRGRKPDLVRWGHRMAMSGLVFLGLTITSGLLLVLDLAIGRTAAVCGAAAFLVLTAMIWVVVPLAHLR